MSSNYLQAGQLLYELRRAKGWTAEDMSEQIYAQFGFKFQTSPRTIARTEASGRPPGLRRQFAIAMVLGTTPQKVWGPQKRPTRQQKPKSETTA